MQPISKSKSEFLILYGFSVIFILCGLVPANPLPAKYMITPQVNGKCIMDVQYKVSAGATFTVTKGSNLILPNNLKLE
jgi:hypothetical protein